MRIENVEIAHRYGESILDAATRAGVFIPSFCYEATFLHNESCCRVCMVEVAVNGVSRIVPACTTAAAANMTVFVNSEKVQNVRAMVLRLMWAQAPGNAALQALMARYGVEAEPGIPPKGGRECILCGKCVRACAYWMRGAIDSMGRGVERRIDTPYGRESEDCLGCGTCSLVCPLGSVEHEDAGNVRTIWHRRFDLLHCGTCGRLLTTRENYLDSHFEGAPALCHECSEEYRKQNRSDDELYHE